MPRVPICPVDRHHDHMPQMNCIRIVQVCFNFSSLELVLCLYTCTVHMYSRPPNTAPRSLPPPQYRHPSSSPNFFLMEQLSFYCVIVIYNFTCLRRDLFSARPPNTADFRIPPLFRQSRDRRVWGVHCTVPVQTCCACTHVLCLYTRTVPVHTCCACTHVLCLYTCIVHMYCMCVHINLKQSAEYISNVSEMAQIISPTHSLSSILLSISSF